MPEFIFDKSGTVAIHGRRSKPNPAEFTAWEHLDAFTQGYIEALFFTEQGDGEAGTENSSGLWVEIEPGLWSNDLGFRDLAPGTLASIIADCAAFQAGEAYRKVREAEDNEELGDLFEGHGGCSAMGGHDFWMTRNGHGCGFWDGDWPEPYDTALTDAAKAFGECSPYLGDDGKVHV